MASAACIVPILQPALSKLTPAACGLCLPACLQNPEAWLRKECSIRQLSISLDQHTALSAAGGGDGGSDIRSRPPPPHSYQPLLRIANLSASALLPAFAWLEVLAQRCGQSQSLAMLCCSPCCSALAASSC